MADSFSIEKRRKKQWRPAPVHFFCRDETSPYINETLRKRFCETVAKRRWIPTIGMSCSSLCDLRIAKNGARLKSERNVIVNEGKWQSLFLGKTWFWKMSSATYNSVAKSRPLINVITTDEILLRLLLFVNFLLCGGNLRTKNISDIIARMFELKR